MLTLLTDTPLGTLVAERPSRAKTLEKYGLDYCCHGKRTLANACSQRNLNIDTVLHDLFQNDLTIPLEEEIDWKDVPLSQLTEHIVTTHHAYLRENLPRLTLLTTKVRDAHAKHHPELEPLAETFASFRSELESHMQKEEGVLFPLIQTLENASTLPTFHCGSVNKPIRVMEHEHDNAGEALEAMRRLTNDYTPPKDACNTYCVMLNALAELETDLHLHVHKENNILFPRAAEREAQLASE